MYKHEMIIPNEELPVQIIVHEQAETNILLHWHRALEVDVLIHGAADFTISGSKMHVEAPNVVVINSGEIHGVNNIFQSDHPLTITYLFPYEFLEDEISDYQNVWFDNPATLSNSIETKSLYQTIYQAYQTVNNKQIATMGRLALMSSVYQCLSILLANFAIKKELPNDLSSEHQISGAIIDVLNRHLQDDLTLTKIADSVHLSVGYLSRMFSKQVGMGVMQYLELLRLQTAFELLTNTEQNIDVIADKAGFPNVKSFNRIFKEVYHQTPGKYRMRLKRS